MKKTKLIIDTDPGHDDVLALMLAIKSEIFDIKAITIVAGNATIENATRNATYTVNLLKADIPIFTGNPSPLERDLVVARVHGVSGLAGIDTSKTEFKLTNNAPEKIVEIINENPGEVTLLTLGPLSNIARALIIDPSIADKVKEIVMMGGAVNIPGNKNRVAEFNFYVDPEAADIVFKSAMKKILVPLDVCEDLVLPLSIFDGLKGHYLYDPIVSMCTEFLNGIRTFLRVDGLLIYDAIAAYYLIAPQNFETEDYDIVIETKGEHTFGMSIADKRKYLDKNINTKACLRVEKQKFTSDFINILKK